LPAIALRAGSGIQQSGIAEPSACGSKFAIALLRNERQEFIGELPASGGTDLGRLLRSRTKTVEAGHQ
jgi:hypothetical protein